MKEINGALFLNAKSSVFLSLILLAASVALTVIIPLTRVYAFCNHTNQILALMF